MTTLSIFGKICWASSNTEKGGWFRLFGFGVAWTHNSITPFFSERIGKRKTITVGNYRYRFLKP